MSRPFSAEAIAWRPGRDYIEQSNLYRFMQRNHLQTLPELHGWSVEKPNLFWEAVVKDLDLEWFTPYDQVLDLSRGVPWAEWFKGGQINMAYNCLDRNCNGGLGHRIALRWEGEDGSTRLVTYAELLAYVNRFANALLRLGVARGDRIGIFSPMLVETVVACLAAMRVGALFTPIFSGYGAEAVALRLRDCDARFLVSADGFWRRGRKIPMWQVAQKAAVLAPSIEKVIMIRRFGKSEALDSGLVWWDDLIAGESDRHEAVRTDAEEPFLIIYTSGTTGPPKGAVHVHAGFPLKAACDMAYCFDVQPGDALFWVTDMGWMMGPWAFLGALLLRGTLVIYEGAPDYPHAGRLWEIVDKHAVNILGVSPTSVRALMSHGTEWPARYPMVSLRVLGSTGEPWNPDPWHWFFQHVGHGRCPIINYSGGTEVSGGILGCFPIAPIKPCSFSGPIPGMNAAVVDEEGKPVAGRAGELALRSPWPGMTKGFWKAPDRYLETYWTRLPGWWVHGDLTQVDADGFWYILGRSDDVIKVAGKRVGPAEVESVLVAHPSVAEAAAVGLPDAVKGEVLACAVSLSAPYEPTAALRQELSDLITRHFGNSLRPATMRCVAELPKTRNGKVLRRLVLAAFTGEEPGDISALENLQALDGLHVDLFA